MYFYIISSNVAVYLAWNLHLISPNFFNKHFVLSNANLRRGRLHTLLTHGFAQQGLLHLLSNMLMVYFIGRRIEYLCGSRMFLQLYFVGLLTGALTQLIWMRHPNEGAIGSSNAGTALFAFYALNFPKDSLALGPTSFTFEAWKLALFFFLLSIYGTLKNDGIGHSGHLGGFLGGMGFFFYKKY